MSDWTESADPRSGVKCWRCYFSRRVRGHITARFEWCVSRAGESPVQWFEAESLELAKRAAEDHADLVPEVGPVPLICHPFTINSRSRLDLKS